MIPKDPEDNKGKKSVLLNSISCGKIEMQKKEAFSVFYSIEEGKFTKT
jgi:hypothetical protein